MINQIKNIKVTDMRVNPGDSAFLIDNGKTAILYDSGFAFTGRALAGKIESELCGRPLDYIFLTHSHYDHALGSVYVQKRFPNVKIIAGEYAAKIFAKPTARAVMRDLDKKFAAKCGVFEYEDLIDELKVDITVNDGDIINAGDMQFRVINLPGHTKCSIGFYMPENKLLLSCETLGGIGGRNIVIPSYLVGCQMTLDSIEKAKQLDINNILIPHCGLLSKDETKTYLTLCKTSAYENAENIAKLMRQGKTDEEIAKDFKAKFYTDEVKEYYPEDAMELNTKIMVDLIRKEYVQA